VKRIILLSFVLILFLTACSGNETAPDERFDQFIDLWNDGSYEQMYEMISSDAKDMFPIEEATERQEHIYNDLNVSNLKVTAEDVSDETINESQESGEIAIPFSVSMDTLAGKISFDYEAKLIREELEEETQWFVDWNPGFIFPELKDGGQVSIQSVEPTRGEILDRNQMPLAMNDIVYEIGIIPENFNAEQNTSEVSQLLGVSESTIEDALSAEWVEPNLFVPLKTVNEQDLVAELTSIDGVTYQETTGRIYPAGETAAHLVGYIRTVTAEDLEEHPEYSESDLIGARGLEQLYEEQLRGEKGYTISAVQPDGEETILAEKPVQNGENVSVTIDVNIQEKVHESYEDDAGTAAAIDPETGETLALVSSPSFDPNEILYGDESVWERLDDIDEQPLLNRFAATFAPGSVIKPITAAIGMNDGTLDPHEGLDIEGLTWRNNENWGDYEVRRVSTSDGPVDLHDALVRSDNIYFAMQAINMGEEAFLNGLHEFGFGDDLPFEYPITASTVSADGEIDNEVLLANTSYGQGEIEMSALHLAAAYTPFINDGNMIKPTLLTSSETGEIWQENLLTTDQAEVVADALEDVVENGTGEAAQEADVQISGKTGTAELKLTAGESGEENGWFVGYPTEDPDILIAMMVEQTQERGGTGLTIEKFVEIMNSL
jgi:penicillin-binding protein